MFQFRRRKVRRKRASTVTKHYVEHKELARELVVERLNHYNQHYKFNWNRVAIRNQRRCWGSCTTLKNLNFNYKIFFLPEHLQDYIIVHEMCHLEELNHGKNFWNLVAEQVPDYKNHVHEIKIIDRQGHSIKNLQGLNSIEKNVDKPVEKVVYKQ